MLWHAVHVHQVELKGMAEASEAFSSLMLEMKSEFIASPQLVMKRICKDRWRQSQSRALQQQCSVQVQRRIKRKNRGWCANEREAGKHNTWALNKNEKLITPYQGCGQNISSPFLYSDHSGRHKNDLSCTRVVRSLFQANVYFIWLDLSWPAAQLIPDVFYLRSVPWDVKLRHCSRCLWAPHLLHPRTMHAVLCGSRWQWAGSLPVPGCSFTCIAWEPRVVFEGSYPGLFYDEQHKRCPLRVHSSLFQWFHHTVLQATSIFLSFSQHVQGLKPKEFYQPHWNNL